IQMELKVHYQKLQERFGDNDFVKALNEGYCTLSDGFLTREVRFVLQKCLTAEFLNSLNELDFSDSFTAAFIFQQDWRIGDFFDKFNSELKAYFDKESTILSGINQDGAESEVRLYEVEDRYHRLSKEFSKYYSQELDGRWNFLKLINNVFKFESQLLNSSRDELQSRSAKKRHVSSALSSDSKSLVASKVARLCEPCMVGRGPQLEKTLGYLKTVCLTPDRAQKQIDGVSTLVNEFLALSHRVSAINNCLDYQNLLELEKKAPLELVYRTCSQFEQSGMLKKLADPMKKLLHNSLVIEEHARVVRVGSSTAGKYLKLRVRPLFAKFFQVVLGVERDGDLRIAVLSAKTAHNFEDLSMEALCNAEQLTKNLLGSSSIDWDGNTAKLSLRFENRPQSSSSGSKPTQAFVLCVFFLTQPNPGGLLPEQTVVSCLSKPIVFITNDIQRSEATAAIEWYASDRPVYPIVAGAPKPLTLDEVVYLIQNYILRKTKHQINADSIAYFREKCRLLLSAGDRVVFKDFIKKPIIGSVSSGEIKPRSLWEFAFCCVNFVSNSKYLCKAMFSNGLVYGFVTRDKADELLRSNPHHPNSLALLRFSETMATVTVAIWRNGETMHEVPKPKKHFDNTSVPEFCYTPIQQESVLKYDGTFATPHELSSYFPKDSYIPGYVAISRDMDLLSLCSGEIPDDYIFST
ncbi:hypothetical protein BOX15_Mlig027911g1, partial [Macrostomum lignano]